MLKRTQITVLIAVWWIAQPLLEVRFYQRELQRGAFPVNADSIGIPIAAFVLGWLIVTPVIVWVVWWIACRAPHRFSWLEFDTSRPTWCVVWTVILPVFAIAELSGMIESIRTLYLLDVLMSGAGAASAMAARAALCARPSLATTPKPRDVKSSGLADRSKGQGHLKVLYRGDR
jgi:hypothetical protein